MPYPPSLILATGATLILLLYKYILHPAFLSPLSRIPNAHSTSAVSPLWILWTRKRCRENAEVYAAHGRSGPVVRLGPAEVSVNCVEDGIRTVYAGGFEKHVWYPNVFTCYDGVRNIFSEPLNAPHSGRKRMMSHVYSKSYLQNSPSAAAVASALIYGRVLPKVGRFATSNAEVNVYTLFNSITMDFVTSYLFGLCNSSNFIENEADADWFLRIYEPRRKHAFWPQEMPKLTNALARIFPLTPAWVDDANRQFEDWCLKMCDAANEQLRKAAEKTGSDGKPDFEQHPENFPVVLQQLTNALNADASKEIAHGAGYDVPVRLKVASEALDHLSAGEETSAVTLTFLFYELAQRPELQERLRDEARSLQPSVAVDPPPSSSPDTAAAAAATKKQLPSAKALSNLPLLHAVLMETLRLHAAIPGPQPRVTPRNRKTILGPFGDIPGDVRVSANAYSLHRNSDVFPEPEAWRPERWLDEEKDGGEAERERMRWFWAFGSGGRMCIGSNFAMQTMRAVTVALVGNFRCEMVDEAQRLEQEDAYTAHPIGHELLLRFVGW